MFWFEPKGGTEPFLVGRFPIFIWEAEDGQQFYGFPAETHERGVKVALHGVGPPCSPETIDRAVREEEIDVMRSYLADRIPALDSTCLEAQTCMYTNTPDRHFAIGLHPHHSGVALAVGCSGHGFKFASVIGEILADLVINGNTRHPISLFDLNRFA
ncbi:FAD-dependent oxidoreductase [Carboxydochorda subterranea]|uniref:FAD-dependent oxidoreductase n=1 Tax=Carboxydichorda subterranea TaxID=3109565 RepID=A0ABZ1BZ43_9FIRM|nr:FAD-dependent oxidoreductase [Limnochorda sp. L945t]WRP18072.1 FAD-dependent oxidoreductase [Limnochorda sp. L945t]